MAWQIVKQPNGKLARFSDRVENFTDINMSEEEALDLCCEHMSKRGALEKVQSGLDDIKPWKVGIKGSGTDRWDYCLKTIEFRHGKEEVNKLLDECNLSHLKK